MNRLMMATIAFVALGVPTAEATTYDFGVVYDINTQASFNSKFNCTVPSPCHGATFVTGNSLYEETSIATKTIAHVGNIATAPTLSSIFDQNSSGQLVFTSFGTNPSYIFPGFALSGSGWQYVQTLSTTVPSFTYQVGGVGTQFSIQSIGLANTESCSCSTGVTIEGFLNGMQVATQSVGIPGSYVGGNGNPGVPASVDIFTLTGFGDVDTVKIVPGQGNVNVNDITISPVAAVPGPIVGAGLPGLLGALGLGGWSWRRRNKAPTPA